MLVLSRRRNEKIVIGDDITITVLEVRGDQIQLGIQAPRSVPVHRWEVFRAIREGGALMAGWEVYGLRPGEGMSVNVVVNEPGGDFFQRIGELMRMSEPEEPVTLTWEEGGVDGMQAFFRSVRLSLPNLPAGEYILSIEVVLPGRTPMVSSTPLIITR